MAHLKAFLGIACLYHIMLGHRSLHPADEDLSVGDPVPVGRVDISNSSFGLEYFRKCCSDDKGVAKMGHPPKGGGWVCHRSFLTVFGSRIILLADVSQVNGGLWKLHLKCLAVFNDDAGNR